MNTLIGLKQDFTHLYLYSIVSGDNVSGILFCQEIIQLKVQKKMKTKQKRCFILKQKKEEKYKSGMPLRMPDIFNTFWQSNIK